MEKKIIKLLKQTTTDNDNEALNAIRMANEALKKRDLHWDDFFSMPRPVERDVKMDALKRKIMMLEEQLKFLKTKGMGNTVNPHIGDPSIQDVDRREEVEIEEKIRICLDAMPYNAFLHSIDDYWKSNGRLTNKQLKSLNILYFNH